MNYFLLNIALALAWAAFTGRFDPENLLFGFVLGYVALLMARRALNPSPYFGTMRQAIGFTLFFLKELTVANLQVAAEVVTPGYSMQPRVLAIPLDAITDLEITAFANLISLTPGTLSLDVSTDRRVLFIHAMYAADADRTRHDLKQGLERRLLDLVRGEPVRGNRER